MNCTWIKQHQLREFLAIKKQIISLYQQCILLPPVSWYLYFLPTRNHKEKILFSFFVVNYLIQIIELLIHKTTCENLTTYFLIKIIIDDSHKFVLCGLKQTLSQTWHASNFRVTISFSHILLFQSKSNIYIYMLNNSV